MQLTHADAIAAAVAYADIFDYPLTAQELRMWLNVRSPQRSRLILQGKALRKFIRPLTAAGITYYSLRRGRGLIKARTQRARWSMRKWSRARWAGRLLRMIHTIKLVGVTGGLAMNNAKQEDDIDLFIIVSSGTLWLTRFFATLLMELFGVRRKPRDTTFADKICLNMFMSESALVLPRTERDLFAAHEVFQMMPLWERDGAYGQFLRANQWVRNFLPNMWSLLSLRVERSNLMLGIATSPAVPRNDRIQRFFVNIVIWILRCLELPVRNLQLWYMQKRRSTEVISDSVIRFHPRDARVWVKQALARRLQRFNVPLDKVFYGR